MKRRDVLFMLASLPAAAVWSGTREQGEILNPYEEVDWDRWEFLHSMSHQHQGQTDASREVFRQMGYRHFVFSNYYPSAPTYPLPPAYAEKHPEVIAAPNAEHHSFTDAGLHANALGSMLATGYGSSVPAKLCAVSPIVRRFDGLNLFREKERPWLGVYRLDVRLAAKRVTDQPPTASLTIEGAHECGLREGFSDKGPITGRALKPGNYSIYLRTNGEAIDTKLVFDPELLRVTQYRLMQGTNRPWRDVFRAALDGEVVDGRRVGGLQYPDGGGMTLNHPGGKLADYLQMLDFDPRVLGIEVWNQLSSGFGSAGASHDPVTNPAVQFYQLWDEILRTGRQCWGFFVKDHSTYGRGRNVLMVPKLESMTPSERERAALRAYRRGCFFGSVAPLATNEAGEIVAPYDRSDFRFSRIAVKRDGNGSPVAIEVSVAGFDSARRPNVQIRFVTDRGVAAVIDGTEAEYPLKRESAKKLDARFVRVEAVAYPKTHQNGKPLTAEMVRSMTPHEISRLHDRTSTKASGLGNSAAPIEEPVPIADLIFSQPLRCV